MSAYTIGDLAERSGFSASALRYYERIGLVTPANRTDAGYRLYDDDALARLAFIDRAKRLGCSLEDIIDLAGLWGRERCEPVQRRFHELLTRKLAENERQIAELTVLREQLRDAASRLAGPPVDGTCSAGCACAVLGEDAQPAPPATRPGRRRAAPRPNRTHQPQETSWNGSPSTTTPSPSPARSPRAK